MRCGRLPFVIVSDPFFRGHISFRPYAEQAEQRAFPGNAPRNVAREFVRNVLAQFIQRDRLCRQENMLQARFDPRALHIGIKKHLPPAISARLQDRLEEPLRAL